MGAEYDYFISSAKTKADVKKEFDAYCKQADHDYGRSCSGLLNMCDGLEFESDIASNEEEAHDLLSFRLEKWGLAKAIRFKEGNAIKWLVAGFCSS